MIGVFKQKNPGNLFVLFLLGLLLRLPAFFANKAPILKDHDSSTFHALINYLQPVATVFPAVYVTAAYFLVFVQAYLLTRFINDNRLMSRAHFLPGMSLVIITAFIPEFTVLSSPAIASPFYILIFIILFSAHNDKITQGDIFNAGLALGIASLLFFPSLLFVIFAYTVLGVLKPFRLNEWLTMLVGLVTPYYFYAAILYLNDSLKWRYFFNGGSIGLHVERLTIWHAGALFLLLMPLLSGIYYIQSLSGRMLIHVRKAWNLFLIYIVVCFIITFFNIGVGHENWLLLMLPTAAIHSYGYFNAEWNLYPKIAFWLSVSFIAGLQLLSSLW